MPIQASESPVVPRVLTIAGSDPSGGAGIQADLKTFLALHTYGLSVITSLTAQNTMGVTSIHTPPAAFVKQQFDTVTEDIDINAIKIGMLSNASVVSQVAELLKEWRQANSGPVVLDTVMVATSGALLLEHDAVRVIKEELLKYASIITPNISEAVHLLKETQFASVVPTSSPTLSDLQSMAKALGELGAKNVLVKGGHAAMPLSSIRSELLAKGVDVFDEALDSEVQAYDRERNASILLRSECNTTLSKLAFALNASVYSLNGADICFTRSASDLMCLHAPCDSYTADVLYETERGHFTIFIKPTIPTTATHGTGCTLSSAIAAMCAHGYPIRLAVAYALQFMQRVLASGLDKVGHGHGPLNHDANLMSRGVALRTPSNPAPLTTMLASRSWKAWRSYTRHPFVQQLGQATLPKESLCWFMLQDYAYLKQYARALSKAVAHPASNLEDMKSCAAMSKAVLEEMQLHVRVCERLGISSKDMESTMESRATVAYTRFFLDVADEGLLPLMISLASCAVGYAEVGLWLEKERDTGRMHPRSVYNEWVSEYAGDAYQNSIANYVELVEDYAQRIAVSESQAARLQQVWDAATRFEIGMWDEALSVGSQA